MLKSVESMKKEMGGLGIATSLVGRASKIFRHDSDLPSSVTQGCGQDTKRKTNMKKLMCAVAALSAGICLADVTSANIVGYSSVAVPANRLYVQGVQFTEVSGLEEIPVKDVLSVDTPVSSTGFGDSADQIWMWNATTMNWVRYYYKHTGRGSSKKTVGWVNETIDGTEETTDTMKNGDAFFFRRASSADGNITISGAIKATNADPVALTANRLHFVCNPWPVSIKIASLGQMVADPVSSTGFGDSADQIWLWDATAMNWVRYYYKHTGRGSSKKVVGWVNETVDGTEETPDEIGVSRGFFFRRASSAGGTLTWVKPDGL